MSKIVSRTNCWGVYMNQSMEDRRLLARKVLLALVVLVGVVLTSSDALACSCAPYPEDEAKAAARAYQQADAIFLGTVSAVKSRRFRPLPVRDATFDVLRAWKGLNGVKCSSGPLGNRRDRVRLQVRQTGDIPGVCVLGCQAANPDYQYVRTQQE